MRPHESSDPQLARAELADTGGHPFVETQRRCRHLCNNTATTVVMSSVGRRGSPRSMPRLLSELPIQDLIGANELGCVPTPAGPTPRSITSDVRRGRTKPLSSTTHGGAEPAEELPTRVYAPASARVPRPPAPGDERFFRPSPEAPRDSLPQLRQPAVAFAGWWGQLVTSSRGSSVHALSSDAPSGRSFGDSGPCMASSVVADAVAKKRVEGGQRTIARPWQLSRWGVSNLVTPHCLSSMVAGAALICLIRAYDPVNFVPPSSLI